MATPRPSALTVEGEPGTAGREAPGLANSAVLPGGIEAASDLAPNGCEGAAGTDVVGVLDPATLGACGTGGVGGEIRALCGFCAWIGWLGAGVRCIARPFSS